MKFYFAPLEGITDLTYRTIHHKYFPGADRYYMPFLSPTQNHCLTKKEQRELPPSDRLPCSTIPQILTKSPEDFLWAAQCCMDRGYKEVNVNMGCPSGTVVAKGKGSGMLGNLEHLQSFLDEIYSKCSIKISVKTRVGLDSSQEFPKILEILNSYPLSELIVHPRVRKAFYKGNLEMDAFLYAMDHSKHPLCYNGDILSMADVKEIGSAFPAISGIMIGRGLITNPGMLSGGTDRETLYAFHEELFDTYCQVFGNKQNAMCRMKEIWSLMIRLFPESEKQEKALKKARDYEAFRAIARQVLTELPIGDHLSPIMS